MSDYLKRIFPVFLSAALFVTILTVCFVRETETQTQPKVIHETGEVIYDPGKVSAKNHAFH